MMVKEIVLCFLLYCQFIRIVKMCLSSINNWRKSRWTHEVVIEIVVAVEIVEVVVVVVVVVVLVAVVVVVVVVLVVVVVVEVEVKVAVAVLVEVVGGNWGGSSNFVLGTFPVLSQDSQPVVKHKSFK